MIKDQAEQLRIAALQANYQQELKSCPKESGCQVIAVSSGKGGVGKTSLVLNLGLALSRQGYRVTLIDADLGLANLDVLLNLNPEFNINDVLRGRKTIEEITLTGLLNIKLVPGGTGLFGLANLDYVRRQHLLEQLTRLEEGEDYMLIDTAAGLSRNVTSLIAAADDFVLVTTPEPTALTDAYGMLKVLATKGMKNKSHVVVNLAKNSVQGLATFKRLQEVTDSYLPAVELGYLGTIPADRVVSEAVYNFSPFYTSHPKSSAAVAVNRIARRLAEKEANGYCDEPGEKKSFFRRLKDYFSNQGEGLL